MELSGGALPWHAQYASHLAKTPSVQTNRLSHLMGVTIFIRAFNAMVWL